VTAIHPLAVANTEVHGSWATFVPLRGIELRADIELCINEPPLGSSKQMSTCCNHMFHTFQIYVAYVSFGYCKVDLVLHMLQWLYTHVASICFKYFSCFKCMLQVFYQDVVYIALTIHICCKCMFQLFQTYVASVLSDIAYVAVAIHICCKHMF
jgi:hypothetical protein